MGFWSLLIPLLFLQTGWKLFEVPPWVNHGGGLANLRHAKFERKISVDSAPSLTQRWRFVAGFDVSATPSIADDGTLFFPSWNGLLYSLTFDGALVWKVNLSEVTGVSGALSRTTPVIAAHNMLLVSIRGPALVVALRQDSGSLIWITKLDNHSRAVVTMSGTAFEGAYYIGVSSGEETAPDCCTFQGSFQKLDLRTGKVLWRTPMLPDNHGMPDQYAGAAVWGSSPSIDEARRLVYIATGNLYTAPEEVQQCEAENANRTVPITPDPCLPDDVYQEAVLALELETGNVRWAKRLGGYDVWTFTCSQAPRSSNCPASLGPDYDFGQAPMLLSIPRDSKFRTCRDKYSRCEVRDIAVTGQKSGIVWALDRDNGDLVWDAVAGPGGTAGGSQWGSAADEERVYVAISNSQSKNFTLVPSSVVTTAGGWVAVNSTTGDILWSVANPSNATAYGPVTVANGVVMVGSFDKQGHVYALDGRSGRFLWNSTTNASVYGGFSVASGCAFIGSGYTLIPFPGSTPGDSLYAFCVTKA